MRCHWWNVASTMEGLNFTFHFILIKGHRWLHTCWMLDSTALEAQGGRETEGQVISVSFCPRGNSAAVRLCPWPVFTRLVGVRAGVWAEIRAKACAPLSRVTESDLPQTPHSAWLGEIRFCPTSCADTGLSGEGTLWCCLRDLLSWPRVPVQTLTAQPALDTAHLRRSSLGWFLFSRFLSMRSESSCLRTSVAYSRRPCRPVMISEATLPRSRMEKLRCSSKVRMKVNRKTLLLMSWAKSFRAFSTCCCPFPCTWVGRDGYTLRGQLWHPSLALTEGLCQQQYQW